jgi:hypothetical protein
MARSNFFASLQSFARRPCFLAENDQAMLSGRPQRVPNGLHAERGCLDAEPVQAKVRPLRLDG